MKEKVRLFLSILSKVLVAVSGGMFWQGLTAREVTNGLSTRYQINR